MSEALILAGLLLLVIAAYLTTPVAGIAAAGLALIVVGWSSAPRRPKE